MTGWCQVDFEHQLRVGCGYRNPCCHGLRGCQSHHAVPGLSKKPWEVKIFWRLKQQVSNRYGRFSVLKNIFFSTRFQKNILFLVVFSSDLTKKCFEFKWTKPHHIKLMDLEGSETPPNLLVKLGSVRVPPGWRWDLGHWSHSGIRRSGIGKDTHHRVKLQGCR